jgi:hypothetical protein
MVLFLVLSVELQLDSFGEFDVNKHTVEQLRKPVDCYTLLHRYL